MQKIPIFLELNNISMLRKKLDNRVIWKLSEPVPPSKHKYKYRLYYGRAGKCRIRYDNERGKGDHKHINSIETDYKFASIDQLLYDFEKDIETWSES